MQTVEVNAAVSKGPSPLVYVLIAALDRRVHVLLISAGGVRCVTLTPHTHTHTRPSKPVNCTGIRIFESGTVTYTLGTQPNKQAAVFLFCSFFARPIGNLQKLSQSLGGFAFFQHWATMGLSFSHLHVCDDLKLSGSSLNSGRSAYFWGKKFLTSASFLHPLIFQCGRQL